MTLLFIEKLLLAWIIVDLLVFCLLVLAKPPVDRARAHHDSAARIIPRTAGPEANFAEWLDQPALQRVEQPNFQTRELTD